MVWVGLEPCANLDYPGQGGDVSGSRASDRTASIKGAGGSRSRTIHVGSGHIAMEEKVYEII